MMKVLAIFIVLFTTCYCAVEFSDRARNFSIELLYFTAEETEWNTVISPLGVWSLLTGVSVGATENSLYELKRELRLPENNEKIIEEYMSFVKSVYRKDILGVTIKSRNYLIADINLRIKKKFRFTIQKDFGTRIYKLNFASPSTTAAIANNLIRRTGVADSDVFTPSDFEDTNMILTNVISFKGSWYLPFNKSDTKVEPFYDLYGNEIGQVNMMFLQQKLAFTEINKLRASVLELPYGDDESNYSFLILLPLPNAGVVDVYKGLETVSLKEIMEELESDMGQYGLPDVALKLPKFKISSNFILNKPLQDMGINDIFDPSRASFKSITDENDLFISAIIHKADIEVTEAGTVASASTSPYIPPYSFNANRPFIYFVIEKTTTSILFGGIYSKPTLF